MQYGAVQSSLHIGQAHYVTLKKKKKKSKSTHRHRHPLLPDVIAEQGGSSQDGPCLGISDAT